MIEEFQNEYRFLSNFWPCDIMFDGILYPSVEHAYQAAKILDNRHRILIRNIKTPGKAKSLGRTLEVREDWEDIKVDIMHGLIVQKFSREPLRKQLMDTEPHELQDGNRWGDTFWGVYNGKGKNILGKILMSFRTGLMKREKFF